MTGYGALAGLEDPLEEFSGNILDWCMRRAHRYLSLIDVERCVFASSGGFLGRGPPTTRIGDVIAIIKGAQTPYILRTRETECYTLVGEAYVHGVMDAEFINEHTKFGTVEVY